MLTVTADGLVGDAFAAGVETTTSFELPDARIEVIVERGRKISDAICDDVIENGGPDVTTTWSATGGAATITIRPGDTLDAGRADLSLDGVMLEDEGGHAITVDTLERVDISVGWLAG